MVLAIMAAGLGSRYKGLKQIEGVGPSGELLMDYSISAAAQAGITEVCVIVRQDFLDGARELLEKRWGGRIRLQFAIQEMDKLPTGFICPKTRIKPWGTGQAVLCLKDHIKSNFAVINADDFYGLETFKMMAGFLNRTDKDEAKASMVSYELGKTTSRFGAVTRGVCKVEGARLVGIHESSGIFDNEEGLFYLNSSGNKIFLDAKTKVSMNFWGFTPSFFDHLERMFNDFLLENLNEPSKEFLLPEVVNQLIQEKKLVTEVMESDSSWFGMTYPEDRENVRQALLRLHSAFF